ncbi:hypothetical protein AK812_SmicGene44266 [Symbiodinium microadriaticum]|uniref:Uncharacterized protein n=1 Tax=Symbiodinium microadriaticum TaxID=2951 RepID=A0A1Q9BYX0_SYMMI|nr:hypothetical protein AK812_SmicGene44266 [Symbiodinium microadriaticum]
MLQNSYAQAKKIMETLEKKGQQHELNLLKVRIEICEHGFALGYNNLSTMKPSVMQAHIMSTKKQWEKYPVSLQLGIVARHAQASLEKVLLSKKKESECWKEAAVELVTFFQFDVEQMLTLDATSFDEHFDGHAPTWQTGIMMMSVSALELAEDSLSSIKLEDDDGLTAEAAQTKIAELQSIATAQRYRYTCDVVNSAVAACKPAKQDFGSKLRALFTHPAWIELLNLQEKAADVHILVCKHLYRHIEAMSSLFTSWIDTPLVPVAEAFEQILAMAKAILHLHAWNPESDAGFDALKPTVPGDVFDFMRCDKQFERSLSKILQDGWWKAQVAEIAKTAGSRPLVQVQWRELNTLLQDISPEQATAQHLSRIAELFETVGKGMREKEMGSVGGKCKDLVVGVVQKLLKSEATALDMTQLSKQADVVMSLLRRFGHEPQIPTLVDDFASWLEGTTNQRQLATLIAHMEKCARGSIDFKAIKQLVPGVGKDKEQSYAVAADEATKLCEAACNFMVKGLLTVNTSAADDAACTQRTADVRLNLAILNGVSKLVKDLVSDENPGRDAFTAYINSCISLGLAGAFHAKEINLLEGLGPDAETRNQADVEAKRLRQAKTARAKCVASEATCVAAQQKLLPFVKAEDGSALHSLVTLKLWESYHYRNNEVYHDCVLHLLSGHETNCTTSAATVVGLCRDRQQGGKEWWRRDLAPGATMDDVFMAAAANTKGVDWNQLKKEVEVLAKDVAKVQADIKFFDNGDSQDIKAKCERVVEVLNDLCAGGLKQVKAFTMEVLLIMVMGRLRKEPTDSNKESVRNLVTLYNVQFAGNCFDVAADDLNPALWAQASAV